MNTESTTKKKPVSLKYISGGIFALISIISLVKQEYFEFTVWLTLGISMLLADMHYLPKGADIKDVPEVPKWRKYLSMALFVLGITAFGYIVGRDAKAKFGSKGEQSSIMSTKADRATFYVTVTRP